MGELWQLVQAGAGRPPRWPVVGVDALESRWAYRASSPSWLAMLLQQRARALRRNAFPPCLIIKPVTLKSRWSGAFLYCPDGRLTAAHRYMIGRLRARDAGLLIICAAKTPSNVPAPLAGMADALVWKALEGFDFSAYALAIDMVVGSSPGADLLLMNDSVLGPFGDIDETLATMPWDLAGFTASGHSQNHIQSYAFNVRALDETRATALVPVISTHFAFNKYRDVIYAQETQLARVAARTMSAGALWYGSTAIGDPSVHAAMSLAQHGFPFLKRKLFHRDAGIFAREDLLGLLEEHRHPLP